MTAAVLEVRDHAGRVRVELGGYVLADSDAVLEVREPGHDPVLYFPPESVCMARLQRSATTTTCSRKGQASYYSIAVGSCFEDSAVWYYPSPIDSAAQLAGYLAFRASAVDAFDEAGMRLMGPALCRDCDAPTESEGTPTQKHQGADR